MLDSSIVVFVATSMLIILSPGQDMVLVLSHSIARGSSAGVITAAGVGTGLLGHTVLAGLGLGNPQAFAMGGSRAVLLLLPSRLPLPQFAGNLVFGIPRGLELGCRRGQDFGLLAVEPRETLLNLITTGLHLCHSLANPIQFAPGINRALARRIERRVVERKPHLPHASLKLVE